MPDSGAKPGPARRRVRKGTKSCWECRGRKIKCIFISSGAGDPVCEGCILRGSKCVSQELPEHPLAKVDRRVPLRNRMLRVERLVGSLVGETPMAGVLGLTLPSKGDVNSETIGGVPVETDHLSSQRAARVLELSQGAVSILPNTPASTSSPGSTATRPSAPRPPSLPQEYQMMSKELLMLFPPEEGVKLVVRLAGLVPPFFHQIAPKTLGQNFGFGEMEKQNFLLELVTRHTSMTHPLVIVRQMLLLAIAFRYIHPASHKSLADFSEWPGEAMKRMGEAAIEFLEKSDRMMETPEGLECLLLASSLYADSGNLRSAWSTTRRAMLLAQLMSLNRQTKLSFRPLEAGVVWDPKLLWYRIVFFDRFFSLALGLPQGSTDNPIAGGNRDPAPGTSSPLWDLQRRHCAIAGQILQRNETDSMPQSLDETVALDHELHLAAQSMPARWWLVPNLASIADDWELYEATLRLTEQVFHDILLTQLHLPLMMQAVSMTSRPESRELSLLTCVNASRDLLQRYMALRNFSSVSYCCHSMDFFAVTASVILLLGYLQDGRSRGVSKTMWHQRASDRAIMEEILANMEQTGTLNKASALSERGATVLGRLLNIEQRVWQSSRMPAVGTHTEQVQNSLNQALHLIIPCLGIVTVNDIGEIRIQGEGNRTNAAMLSEDVSAQPATKINESRQHGMANHNPDSMDLNDCYFGDQSKQSDVPVSDAHMAFLTSVMDNNGQFRGSVESDSWWLL